LSAVADVRVEAVRKALPRSGRWVLDVIDATPAGVAVTLVVGGNGSGQTSLLRAVAGASTPPAGRVVRPRMTARQYVRHMAHAVTIAAGVAFGAVRTWRRPQRPPDPPRPRHHLDAPRRTA
jgi:ABC-type sulfate/molybdate transport systems ATPase subunit